MLSRRSVLGLVAVTLLVACVGSGFETYYDQPIPAEVTQGWRVTDVRVSVPQTLVVSEQKTYLPKADIVWREDPLGDRRAQVATIMRNAVLRGAAGLRGSRAVVIEITMTRFHALTFEAETKLKNAGVHNINFVAQVVDADTGAILAGPAPIKAELPALSGDAMRAARQRGETQKSQITAHVARTIAGWLSIGPDPRSKFSRSGN
ncbi:DUF6778 family protein [Tabrizicola sp.]|uniref:DUF6778 family protein n=1 Tax=Tabrizicola sp. TaxID=2005166 RepID=UPI00286C6332|nr:DUF6778 family protein [Tabrizicola sp.]